MRLGINRQPRVFLLDRTKERIDLRQAVDLIAEELDTIGILVVGWEDFDDVSSDAEGSAPEVDVISFVENLYEPTSDILPLDLLSSLEEQEHAIVGLRRTKAVDAGDGTHNDCVTSLKEGASCGETQLVELLVDGGFLLDEQVARRNVGLRLVVVVVGHEILNGIVGEELFELVVELGSQGFVVGKNESRSIRLSDNRGHRERLARSSHPEQHLILLSIRETGEELANCPRLIALWGVGRLQLKVHPSRIRLGMNRRLDAAA